MWHSMRIHPEKVLPRSEGGNEFLRKSLSDTLVTASMIRNYGRVVIKTQFTVNRKKVFCSYLCCVHVECRFYVTPISSGGSNLHSSVSIVSSGRRNRQVQLGIILREHILAGFVGPMSRDEDPVPRGAEIRRRESQWRRTAVSGQRRVRHLYPETFALGTEPGNSLFNPFRIDVVVLMALTCRV